MLNSSLQQQYHYFELLGATQQLLSLYMQAPGIKAAANTSHVSAQRSHGSSQPRDAAATLISGKHGLQAIVASSSTPTQTVPCEVLSVNLHTDNT